MFERHLQSVLVAVVIGLMGWVGISVSQQTVAIARLQVSVTGMQAQIKDVTATSRDAYSRQNARDVHARFQAEVDRLDSRVRRLEERGARQ